MSANRVLVALLGVVLSTSWASAFDLTTIDRRIDKEPRYQGKPTYCLVVFGPKAEKRVWLVLDGDVLYVDRNGNGDLTEDGKRVERSESSDAEPPEAGKPLKFQIKNLTDTAGKAEDLEVSFDGLRARLLWTSVRFLSSCGKDAQGFLHFADRPQAAPVVHFGGPLRLGFIEPPTFRRGEPSPDFRVVIGTHGLGKGTLAYLAMAFGSVPRDTRLTAEIEFPSKAPGGSPIKTEQVLRRD